jgi:hypothetical protein
MLRTRRGRILDGEPMAVKALIGQRESERRFFALVAVLFPLLALAGFARTYYLKAFFHTPPLSSALVHLHGLLMTTWIVLFVTQVWLISSRRVKTHQRLGMAGVILGVLIIAVGLATAIAAGKYGSPSTPPDIPPLVFMVVPFGDLLMFAIFFGGAVYYRKRPAEHKRLILLTILNFLPPAIGRLPLAFLAALGPLAFFGIPDLLAILFLIVDTRRNGRLNKVFLVGTMLLIASHPLRIMLSGTALWLRFATWVTA